MKTPSSTLDNANKLQYIDCLRGIAILLVILNHADWHLPTMNTAVQTLSDYGQMGVQLFFVVSAFTLCLSMDRRNNNGENLKTFYVRRYFRIAPLYYLGIPLYFIYHSVLEPLMEGGAIARAEWYTLPNILANVFFLNGFVPGDANNRVVPGGWSIGTEMIFYLIFPFIFLKYNKYKNNDKALSLIPVIGFLCSFIAINTMEFFALEVAHYQNFNYFKQNGRFLYFNIICQLPVFLMGMSLYFRSKNMAKSNRWDKAALLLSFTAFRIIALFIFNYHSSRITLLSFLPAISFFFLFLIFKEFSFLSHKILARIGQLSFSIYLFHFLFAFEGSRILYSLLQNYMRTEIIFGINVVLTTAITAGVAVLSEKYIEKPGIEMGRRMIKKIKARGAAAQLQQLAPKESIS